MTELKRYNASGQDHTAQLQDAVQQAIHSQTPINIVGGGSKAFLGRSLSTANSVCTSEHSGIVNYEPTELVVTVRAGTPMKTLNALLADNKQMLPFEPPVLNAGTIGGVLACGLSGPARPFVGSARDYVLGMRVINGKGEALRFGGEVMKNVAGYDAARLHVGAYGSLGVLLETSMKVLPMPEASITLRSEVAEANSPLGIVSLMRQPLPLSAAVVHGKTQTIRLSGSAAAVEAAARVCGGESVDDGAEFWTSIRDFNHEFFNDDKPLWRISVPEFTDALPLEGEWLIDWAGGQRFLKTHASANEIFEVAAAAKGHAICYSSDRMSDGSPLFQPLEGAMRTLQKRVRDSFDANRIFNPGRFHPELDS